MGSGPNTKIVLATDRAHNRSVVLKIIDARQSSAIHKQKLLREIAYHERVAGHPNVVGLIDHFICDELIYIVMEYAPGGDLFNYLKDNFRQLAEPQRRRLLLQVCSAVQHLHRMGFMHRDIKPENILLDDKGDAKLCDFGWCCHLDDTRSRYDNAGTFEYMSPECLRREFQDQATDVWSLGILLYELYHGVEPFPGRNTKDVLKAIYETSAVFRDDIPEDAIQIFEQCVRFKPENRINVEQLLSHRYFDQFRGVNIPSMPFHFRKSNEESSETKTSSHGEGGSETLMYRPSRVIDNHGPQPSVQVPPMMVSNPSPVHSAKTAAAYFQFPQTYSHTNTATNRSPIRYSPLTSPQRSVSPALKQQVFQFPNFQPQSSRIQLGSHDTAQNPQKAFIRPQAVPDQSPPQLNLHVSGVQAVQSNHSVLNRKPGISFGQLANPRPTNPVNPLQAGLSHRITTEQTEHIGERRSNFHQQPQNHSSSNQRSLSHGILHMRNPSNQPYLESENSGSTNPSPTNPQRSHFMPNPLIAGLQRPPQVSYSGTPAQTGERVGQQAQNNLNQTVSRLSDQMIQGHFSFSRPMPTPHTNEEQKIMFGPQRVVELSSRQRTSGMTTVDNTRFIRQPILAIGGKSFQETMSNAAASDGFMRFRPDMQNLMNRSPLGRSQVPAENGNPTNSRRVIEFPIFTNGNMTSIERSDLQAPAFPEGQTFVHQQQTYQDPTVQREHSQDNRPTTARPMTITMQNQTYQKPLRPASVTIMRDRSQGFTNFDLQPVSGISNFSNTMPTQRQGHQISSVASQPIMRGIPGGLQSFKTQVSFGQHLSSQHTASASLLPERPQLQLSTPRTLDKRFF